MGPNGAGKSTLAGALLGHPAYTVTAGSILLNGEDVTGWATDVRAKAGLFLAFQYPESIEGVSVTQFLRQAMAARKGTDEVSVLEVRVLMTEWMERLGMDTSFASRHLNQGFSGGEKKRNEILQMALLEPLVAVLDETDSGLDIDALRVVGRGVRAVREARPELGVLAITHYTRLLEELVPDVVHILMDGRIVASGGPELAAAGRDRGLRGVAMTPDATAATARRPRRHRSTSRRCARTSRCWRARSTGGRSSISTRPPPRCSPSPSSAPWRTTTRRRTPTCTAASTPPPRRPPPCTSGPAWWPAASSARPTPPARSSSPRTRPSRSTWWPSPGAGPTCARATPCS